MRVVGAGLCEGDGSARSNGPTRILLVEDLSERIASSSALVQTVENGQTTISSGRNALTTQFGASTTSLILRSTATLARQYASSLDKP